MIKQCMAGVCVAVAVALATPAAQTTTGRGAVVRKPVAPPAPTSVRIAVRDEAGTSLASVRLLLTGASTGEFTTGAAGTAVVPNLKPGVYRVRCERDGFVTFEREFTLGTGAWNPIDIVLNAAPPPPPPPPPPAPEPPPAAPIPASGAALTLSIPDFLDRNLIRREPFKESVLSCTPLETVRLLQLREGIAAHVHERLDEVVYVVAGEGAFRMGKETTPIAPGSLVVVPNGNSHSFERRGKNPLIVVSTLAGAACKSTPTTP
jgi:hypothetical protein